jgi:hypothetical protein
VRQAGDNSAAMMAFLCRLGQTVFSLIPEVELRKWIPYHDVQILPGGLKILVLFRSLLTAKGRGGTIYYSRFKPTVEINGQSKIVGFSQHAIERICERVVPRFTVNWNSWWSESAGMGT